MNNNVNASTQTFLGHSLVLGVCVEATPTATSTPKKWCRQPCQRKRFLKFHFINIYKIKK